MDTSKNTPGEPTPADATNNTISSSGPALANEQLDDETEEESRLSEFISNIPWGKIILGAFVLFVLIWGVIYLFSSKSGTTVVVTTPIQIEEAKKSVAQDQAVTASELLGHDHYNATLQPHFSLEPTDITATEPKVALLQSAGVLEQTLNFDLWADLSEKTDRQTGLTAYETKLSQTLSNTQAHLAQVTEKKQQVISDRETTSNNQRQVLTNINTLLLQDPSSAAVVTAYQAFVANADQIARLSNEQSLIDQTIAQATPLIARAVIRQNNIQLNRQAIVQGIKVVDLDDPGLKLISKPTKVN